MRSTCPQTSPAGSGSRSTGEVTLHRLPTPAIMCEFLSSMDSPHLSTVHTHTPYPHPVPRGLKSFRSSPWDSKEWLPREYASVFAFENFKRAHKRARAAVDRATADLDPCAVSPGALVVITVEGVPATAAAAVIQRVARLTGPPSSGVSSSGASATGAVAPLVAFGLMQHEGKLSVVHGGIKKAATFTEPIRNKENLLIVTGEGWVENWRRIPQV